MAKVTVITATTGHPILPKCIESVAKQTHADVQHLLIVDGRERSEIVTEQLTGLASDADHSLGSMDQVHLPYSIGKDRWNGHRIYAAGTYMAKGQYVMYLDQDNYIDPTHIADCLKVIESGNDWAYSLRKIVNKEGDYLCHDDCESLGKWPSILDPDDYFVDVNCYFLPIKLAVHASPIWFRKTREPGQLEVDRALCRFLRQIAPKYDSTYGYTVNYTAGSSDNSVQKEFFITGNAAMLKARDGILPWKNN